MHTNTEKEIANDRGCDARIHTGPTFLKRKSFMQVGSFDLSKINNY